MAGQLEIIIKREVIRAEAARLRNIARSVSNRKITYTAAHSKGKTAKALNDLITELNSMGSELGRLMFENTDNVLKIAEQFSQKDRSIASALKG